MQPCRATSASGNSDLLSQITTQLSGNPLWLYKDDPLRVIKSYSPHMQNVHVGSNIIFILFIFYSHLPPDVARFGPTTRRRAMKSGRSYATFASRNDAQSSPPPPLPLFSSPLTTMPPLLFDTTSPPCSDPLLSQTSSPLHCHLRIPIALAARAWTSSQSQPSPAALRFHFWFQRKIGRIESDPPLWRPPHRRRLRRWTCKVHIAGVGVP
jgi:hypothetical protein